MRQKISSFAMAALLVGCVVSLTRIVGDARGNAAIASPALYWGAAHRGSSPEKTAYILKTVSYNPDHFLKVRGEDVFMLLRQPELVRTDLPTVIWQYRNESCVLDVFFAAAEEDVSEAPVVHYEARSRGKSAKASLLGPAEQKECIRSLIDVRDAPQMVDVSRFYKAPKG